MRLLYIIAAAVVGSVDFFLFFPGRDPELAAPGGGGSSGEPSLAAGPFDGCQLAEGLGASTFTPRTRAAPLIGTFTYPSARGGGAEGRGVAVRIDRTASTIDPPSSPRHGSLPPSLVRTCRFMKVNKRWMITAALMEGFFFFHTKCSRVSVSLSSLSPPMLTGSG